MTIDVETDDVAGVFANGVDVSGKLHATSLSTTPGVDLGLDHDGGTEAFSCANRLVDGERRFAGTNRHAVTSKELFALMFEEIHRILPLGLLTTEY